MRDVEAPSFAVLVLLAGVGPLATDMYLPALPRLGPDLGTSASVAQLTLTAFIVGSAVGQVFLGPLSDATGRRVFVIVGPVVFALASAACAVTGLASGFLAARVVQGLAAGAALAATRAVVSDHYRGPAAASRFGLLAGLTLFAPVVAPVVGTGVLLVGTWRTTFWVLAVVGVAQLVGVVLAVPETLPATERQPASPRATAARMRDMLADWSFAGHVVVQCLAMMGFFAYIGGSAFVLQDGYGLPTTAYGLVFAGNSVALVLTSFGFARLAGGRPVSALRRGGLAVSVVGAGGLVVAVVVGSPPLWLVLALLPLVTAGMGLVIPASMTLAQQAGARARGTASALNGGLGFSCGGLVTPLPGLVPAHALPVMAGAMAGFLGLAILVSRVVEDPVG